MKLRLLASMIIVACAVGCAESRTYSVSLKNNASKPVVAWLTKTGGPFEPMWRSPEDFAIERPGGASGPSAGVFVQPGETVSVGPVAGKFDSSVNAVLRVYLNAKSINDLLAINRYSPNRLDLGLRPGENHFVVSDKTGKLAIDHAAGDNLFPDQRR